MYVNKCIKCGAEFETKNPKRVICPSCLYADKSESTSGQETGSASYGGQDRERPQGSYSYGQDREQRPRNNYSRDGYQQRFQQGGYQRREVGSYGGGQSFGGGYSRDRNVGGYQQRSQQGGYNRDRNSGGYQQRSQQGGYNRDRNAGGYQQRSQQGGFNRDRNGFNNRRPQGGGRFGGAQRKPQRPPKQAKPLLVTKEQLEVIEALYKTMLPLPNPNAHEVIGEKMGLEPRKVFFGINLVRQTLMLPKLPFPKRKLAISEDQLLAIKSLYEPLLPLPPIGCHKIIATQLRMDEWRVHVGIGLIRSQMGLERWNQEREDAPEEYKKQAAEAKALEEKATSKKKTKKDVETEVVEEEKPKAKKSTKKLEEVEEAPVEKKTRGRKKAESKIDQLEEEKPKAKKTTRKTKKDEE